MISFYSVRLLFNALVAFLASCANGIVIYTIARTPSLRTPSNILILGLAISDFGVGVLVQPSYCVYRFAELTHDYSLYCSSAFVYAKSMTNLGALSFISLSTVIADRFLAVHLHLHYKEFVTSKRAWTVLGFGLTVCTCYSIINVIFKTNQIVYIFGITLLIVFLILDVCFFTKISRVLYRHSVQVQAQQLAANMPRKSVITIFYVIGPFLLCYAPFVGVILAYNIKNVDVLPSTLQYLVIIAETLLFSNGVLNPIIYFWRIEEMRNAARRLLRRLGRHHDNGLP